MELGQFQIILREVRDSFLSDFMESDFAGMKPRTVEDINNGWCADFATVVRENVGPDVYICNDEELAGVEYSHTFIQFGEMYYDAECIEGVHDWTQLPLFRRQVERCRIRYCTLSTVA